MGKRLIPSRRRGRPKSREESVGPTPQTLAKLERDQLSHLLSEGELNPDQERAGRKIHSFTMALRRGSVPTSSFKAGLVARGKRAPKSPTEKLNETQALHWSRVYSPWAKAMSREVVARRPPLTALGLIERVVNENSNPVGLAASHSLAPAQLLEHLRDALDRYIAQEREKNIL